MRDENDLLKGGLIIVGILIAAWAFWRVWNYETNANLPPEAKPTSVAAHTTRPQEVPSLETLKTHELLDSFLAQDTPDKFSANSSAAPQPYTQQSAAQPSPRHAQNSSALAANRRPQQTGATTPSRNYASGKTAYPSGTNAYTSAAQTDPAFKPGVYKPTAEEELNQERARMLAPYLIPNKKAQQDLDRQLADLSTGITRALNRVLTPKSKKESNIEKYLNQGDSKPAADPFTDVINQVKNQKASIVGQTQSAFGDAAGQRAGALMDSFQRDLSQAVNNPAQTDQQKAQAVQNISRKYQKELDKMNQENQFNKFVENRIAQDNEKLAALDKAYENNRALHDQFSQIFEKSRQADFELAQRKDLSPEEYAQAFYANQYKQQEDLKQAVQKAGASAFPLNKVLTDQAEIDAKKRLQAEKEGNIPTTPNGNNHTPGLLREYEEGKGVSSMEHPMSKTDLGALLGEIDKEREKMLTNIETNYGKETAARFEPILKEYRQKNLELGTKPMSDAARQNEQIKTVKEFNQKILQMQIELVKESQAPQETKDAQIKQLEKAIADLQ